MSIMLQPVLPVPGPEALVKSVGASVGGGDGNSFASQLDRELNEKYGSRSDMLGVGGKADNPPPEAAAVASGQSASAVTDSSKKAPAGSIEDLLSQFMAVLQNVATTRNDTPGNWQVQLADTDLLQKIALDAGMSEADFSRFLQQFTTQDNKINLTDFFSALTSYFQGADKSAHITVPESELPMLESLLTKMGVPQETVSQLANQAVSRDGALDLDQLLQGLAAVPQAGLSPVTLTDQEAEQLQQILAEAGLTLEKQNELLPERYLNQALGQAGAGQPVQLSLERLQNIVRDTLAGVRDNQPKVDLPAFMADLQKVISQSNFESQGVGWTPVVEHSVDAIFKKLQDLVDLARVKIEQNRLNENRVSEGQLAEAAQDEQAFADWVKGLEEKFAKPAAAGTTDDGTNFAAGRLPVSAEQETATPAGDETDDQPAVTPLPVKDGGQQPPAAVAGAKEEAPAARIPFRLLEQQMVQQLSDGVVRGLKNQEHHLVLRLYPQDLGEVKVSLTVRDDHVAVSFNMENHRVKEMLESNMEEFKNSMKDKGFNLEQCFVSVGQQNDQGGAQQRFAMLQPAAAAPPGRGSLAEIPSDALYLQAASPRLDGRGNGINLVV